MLLLLFETSAGRYALDTRNVVEIIPLLQPKRIPSSPGYVAGIINYRGKPVPVFDICALEGEKPSRNFYSTRIVIVRYRLDERDILVGMITERTTDIVKCSESEIRSSGILLEKMSTVDDPESGQEEIVQLFDVQRMLPEDIIRDNL